MENFSITKTFTKRFILYILATILIGLIIIGLTSVIIATHSINQARVNEQEKQLEEIRQKSQFEIFVAIFRNNFYIALNLIPPLAGQVFFFAVMYSTAEIFASRSIQIGENLSISPYLVVIMYIFSLMFSPDAYFFGFLEFLGYALALTQSFNLINSAISSFKKRDLNPIYNELKFTVLIIIAIAIVLLVAAFLESLLV